MIEELTKEETDLIIREVMREYIEKTQEIKDMLAQHKTLFNIKYIGSNKFICNSNRALEHYLFDDLKKEGFTIVKVFPRENNEGPALTIELTFVKPKRKGTN